MIPVSKEKNFVSCVVYLHNEENRVEPFLEAVCGVMEQRFEKYEIVCVNDGCLDATVERVKEFVNQTQYRPVISMVNLSYYQGAENAMNAGSDLAVGDFLFEFERCELDFAPSLIMDVYYKSLEGYDVVSAVPGSGEPLTSRLFYAIYNWGNRGKGKLCHERFRVVSRRAVNRVGQMNIYIPYRKALYMNCGLKTAMIPYENHAAKKRRGGREEREIRSNLALDTIVIFTGLLEKLSMAVSIILLGALLIMFGYLVYSIFSRVRPVEGWLSIMFLMSFGFFMLSVMLTLIFKYLSLILNMTFKRQRYVIEGVEKLTK